MADAIKADKGFPSRNKHFGNEELGKGFSQKGIPEKNPTEVSEGYGAHDTAPEMAENSMREDKVAGGKS